jgi:hypothetical protein
MRAALLRYLWSVEKSNSWILRILKGDAHEEVEVKNWLKSFAESSLNKINKAISVVEV